MKIDLIAWTQATDAFQDVCDELDFDLDPHSQEAEDLIEFAGRLCYESYSKPNEATRANKDYLANVALQKHFSVFEHASVTFLFRGVSRALTHELVRHRHFSYSQVSQRYCDSSKRPLAEHSVLEQINGDLLAEVDNNAEYTAELYGRLVEELILQGYSRKEARGAARLVLPEGTTTDIVVTGNFRSWLEFIDKRATKFADAEIRELATEILRQLRDTFPNAFQDAITDHDDARPVPVSIQKQELEDTPVDIASIVKAEIARVMKELFN